ncbi:coenzyme F420-0:L-glutamate ligase [Patescibacteria group bacterium]|nr:coenzyme F420-0:L-glutamate ligase [Patescibacteria group bacterium]
MLIKPIKTRVFKPKNNLLKFINQHVKKLKNGDVLVITSKIVSLAQGRVKKTINNKTRERLIKQESQFIMRGVRTWLTVKDGVVMTSAGVDRSNGNGQIILLPKNSFAVAQKIRLALLKKFKLKNLGVLITDSRSLPLRAGSLAVAMGYAGFKGLVPKKGSYDMFKQPLKTTRINIGDSLATAAVLAMGETNEQTPLAIVNGAPIIFTDKKINRRELIINPLHDNFKPFFDKLSTSRKLKKLLN